MCSTFDICNYYVGKALINGPGWELKLNVRSQSNEKKFKFIGLEAMAMVVATTKRHDKMLCPTISMTPEMRDVNRGWRLAPDFYRPVVVSSHYQLPIAREAAAVRPR